MKIPIRILMERYQNHLYRIAFSICQNREDAEDVVQDTFLQYHILKKEFEDETHIRAWLMRVAINKSRNIVRAFWRKHRQSLESYMEELDFPDTESSTLFEAVLRLPEKQRTVIHLFYYEDYTIKEIAEILHTPHFRLFSDSCQTARERCLQEFWSCCCISGYSKLPMQRLPFSFPSDDRSLPAQPHFSPQALSAAGSPCTSPTT